ncbi:MAG: insulinase family protein, partial [Candidatus Cloacimonetes bacterium]|nr:insulinase family protein [Candidatus Cloacimonadota bacterium]
MSNNGFEIKETRFVKELNANVNIYQHTRSGAKLLHIDADDDNKVFCVAFRTPPTDSTGVAHILEHSVLCGSDKYPLKEPFVELLKGSLYTFLNAMTGSAHTFYPVASTNDKDFKTLAEVYIDAVFFPNIHKIDEIFYQEGWHYEMQKAEDDLTIKGVVYNEMKGAYSSPNRVLHRKLSETLCPDNVYKNCSGGYPDDIPNLTLADFKAFHKKYYHPANSYFVLYGKMNIAEMFEMINNEALKKFVHTNIESCVLPQKLFPKPVEAECVYSISPEESETDKTWFGLEFMLDIAADKTAYFSWSIIGHLLFDTPAAPLRNALLRAGICKDVYGGFTKENLQPTFLVILVDSNPVHKDTFIKIFFETLRDLVEKGIDKQLIEASININEFHFREANMERYPKGFVYAYYLLSEWIHDRDPIAALCYEELLTETRESLIGNYYEMLIKKSLLENPHYALVTMKPEKGLMEKKDKLLKEKLANIKAKMSPDEVANVINITQKILDRQNSVDSPEAIKKIPTLQISDVKAEAEHISFPTENFEGVTVLKHPIFSNGIGYVSFYFETNHLPDDLIPYAQLLENFLGAIHTKKYHYGELSNLINIHTGGFDYENTIFTDLYNEDKFRSFFTVKTKCLIPKIDKMAELLAELTSNTLFDDNDRIKEILYETKTNQDMKLAQAGHAFTIARINATLSASGLYSEQTGGIEF